MESNFEKNEFIIKQTDSQISKTNLWLPKGKRGKGDKLGSWD